uniref:Uncharacterized protein n=1 Tax=Panstrongylus lignarius TaxID=156445 RepID=A0A224XSF8_9HEMI
MVFAAQGACWGFLMGFYAGCCRVSFAALDAPFFVVAIALCMAIRLASMALHYLPLSSWLLNFYDSVKECCHLKDRVISFIRL